MPLGNRQREFDPICGIVGQVRTSGVRPRQTISVFRAILRGLGATLENRRGAMFPGKRELVWRANGPARPWAGRQQLPPSISTDME